MNSFQQWGQSAALALLALLLAGCASTPVLEIVNDSDKTICAAYVSLSSDEYWGNNNLQGVFGSDQIAPGDTYALSDIDLDSYDIRMEDCAQNLLLEAHEVRLEEASLPYRLHVTQTETWYGDEPDGATLRITNLHPSDEICYLQISASSSETWGSNRLSVDETIASDHRREFPVGKGNYDVIMYDCDEQVIYEEYEIPISDVYDLRYGESE